MSSKATLKKLLEELPFSAEVYWQLRGQYKQWSAHYKLEGLRAVLPEAVREVQAYALPNPAPKKIAIFASLHYCCLLYTSPSPRDRTRSRMPSSA